MVPNCTACSEAMVEGYLPDHGHGVTTYVEVWVQGEPILTLLGNADIDSAPKYFINAYRCPKCGIIQLYGTKRTY
jgi:Domain of unknown function (DUF6487)